MFVHNACTWPLFTPDKSSTAGALFSVVVSSESVAALLGSLLWPLLLPVMLDIKLLCNSGSIFFVMAGFNVVAVPLVM